MIKLTLAADKLTTYIHRWDVKQIQATARAPYSEAASIVIIEQGPAIVRLIVTQNVEEVKALLDEDKAREDREYESYRTTKTVEAVLNDKG